MSSSRMYTRGERDYVKHDRNFVKNARINRREKHVDYKNGRERRSFSTWAKDMQNRARKVMKKQSEQIKIVLQRSEKY